MTTIKPCLTGRSKWGCPLIRSSAKVAAQISSTSGVPVVSSENVPKREELHTALNAKTFRVKNSLFSVRQDLIEHLVSETSSSLER
jgi:hypothetical protein